MKNKQKTKDEEKDDLSKLEELHKTMERERIAWEKLIENLNELILKNRKPQ